MLEFGARPPEVNSGLMYAGPGSTPMLDAAAAWDALADDLYVTATDYAATISRLTSSWLGPSSASMAAAAAPYVSWISATAAQAAETAAQAKQAVVAYEAAFSTTVPPAVIAANRALLLMLVATNFFGQNTPAIAATEAEYVEMWAQDAAAMYGYAAASSAASALPSFTAPLQTTNPAGLTGLATTVTQAAGTSAGTGVQTVSPLTSAATPSALESLTSTASSSTSTSPLSSLTTVASETSVLSGAVSSASMSTSGIAMLGSAGSLMNSFGSATSLFGNSFQMSGAILSPGVGSGASALGAAGTGGNTVTAAAGRAASLGALSIPQGWTAAAPAFSQVASALPAASGPGTLPQASPGSTPAPFGAPEVNTAGRGGTSQPLAARYYLRPPMVQRPVYAG